MEELVLTDPVVEPEKGPHQVPVMALTLDVKETMAGVIGNPPDLIVDQAAGQLQRHQQLPVRRGGGRRRRSIS